MNEKVYIETSMCYRTCKTLVSLLVVIGVCGCASSGIRETFCSKLEGVSVRLETARKADVLGFSCDTRGCHLAKVSLHDPYGRERPVQNLRTVVASRDSGGFSVGFGVCTIDGHDNFGTSTGVGMGFPLDRREGDVSTRGNFILPSSRMMTEDWAITCLVVLANGEEMQFLFWLPAEPAPALLADEAAKQVAITEKAEGAAAERIKELERRKAILLQSLEHKPIVPNAEGLEERIEKIEEQIEA